MNTLPLCRSCVHCVPDTMRATTSIYTWARCDLVTVVDPVSGDTNFIFCSTERTALGPNACGPQGIHFAPIMVAA